MLEASADRKCPPRNIDNALDPIKLLQAEQNNQSYQKMLLQTQVKKIDYLNQMATSELYKKKNAPTDQEKTYFSLTAKQNPKLMANNTVKQTSIKVRQMANSAKKFE